MKYLYGKYIYIALSLVAAGGGSKTSVTVGGNRCWHDGRVNPREIARIKTSPDITGILEWSIIWIS